MDRLVDQLYFVVNEFFEDVAVDEVGEEEYPGIGNQQWDPKDACLHNECRTNVK